MKTNKLLIILLIIGGLYIVSKTIYNKTKETQIYKQQNIDTVDSLTTINNLLIDYYCASENLLDSIFVRYSWPDAMDNYPYYESIENIYTYNEHMYNYLESLRKGEKYK